MGYIYLPNAYSSAIVCTKNKVVSPTVPFSQQNVSKNAIKLVIVNSGNANAVTGKQGEEDVQSMADTAAGLLRIAPSEVVVASTGIIGQALPMDTITQGLEKLLHDPNQSNGHLFEKAILTTDLVQKSAFKSATINGKDIQIAGVTKGSGMIAPNMATTLGFIVCNVAIDQEILQSCLNEAIDNSYNMISVDTDTSTNDMVVLQSTGAVTLDASELHTFKQLLTDLCIDLAKQIILDGEGATKLITTTVKNAQNDDQATAIVKAVIDSPLVKTAIHGEDPNWGRILMAIGKPQQYDLAISKVSITLNDIVLLENGQPVMFDKDKCRESMKATTITININLNTGSASKTGWGCDLSKGYIDINTAYN